MEPQLFLGFVLSRPLEKALKAADPTLVKLFVSEKIDQVSDYLHLITYEQGRYLGKLLGKGISLSQFELTCANLYSVAQKVIGLIHTGKPPLILLTLHGTRNADHHS